MSFDYKTLSDWIRTDHLAFRLQHRIHYLLAKRMDLRRVRIVWAVYPPVLSQSFTDAVYDAEEFDVITERQLVRILSAGMIVSARRRGGGEDVYVALEVYNKLIRDDVDNAAMTAKALALAFPQTETMTAVYGREISDEDMAYAESEGVAVILAATLR